MQNQSYEQVALQIDQFPFDLPLLCFIGNPSGGKSTFTLNFYQILQPLFKTTFAGRQVTPILVVLRGLRR